MTDKEITQQRQRQQRQSLHKWMDPTVPSKPVPSIKSVRVGIKARMQIHRV